MCSVAPPDMRRPVSIGLFIFCLTYIARALNTSLVHNNSVNWCSDCVHLLKYDVYCIF